MKSFSYKRVRKEKSELNPLSEQQNFELLDLNQAAEFLKLKPSYMYSLIHQNKIPHYKPNGKRVYFIKSELITWIMGSKVKTIDEVEADYKKYKQTQTN